jgi:spore coat polysaccharide biosynthesis protein SpsF
MLTYNRSQFDGVTQVTKKFTTPQEEFWAGEFGNDYSARNAGRARIAANCALFARVLSSTRGVESIIEFGSSIGLNLRALDVLLPDAKMAAIEINGVAAAALKEWGRCEVFVESILDFEPPQPYDLVLIKGVLIHVNPESLAKLYERLFRTAAKYICIVEYYNPTPISVRYRGHDDRLFRRDFAGELLDSFSQLSLLDYGFCYHRDPNFPQDDVNWFLLAKGRV